MNIQRSNSNSLSDHLAFYTDTKYSEKPTFDMYGFVQAAFDHFNNSLFQAQLSDVLFTFQREKNVMGYFSQNRWDGKRGKKHEIAINPNYFITRKPLEFYQTLVHEMCHQWQFEYGKPSRRAYHNREWAIKMESVGLMPSSTGEPGGKKTGQKISDYPIPGGLFCKECIAFTKKGIQLPYVDINNAKYEPEEIRSNESGSVSLGETSIATLLGRTPLESEQESAELLLQSFETIFPNIDLSDTITNQTTASKKNKVVFQCPECGDKAWGKPSLNLICGNCDVNFIKLT